jgi:hypothetical protein
MTREERVAELQATLDRVREMHRRPVHGKPAVDVSDLVRSTEETLAKARVRRIAAEQRLTKAG